MTIILNVIIRYICGIELSEATCRDQILRSGSHNWFMCMQPTVTISVVPSLSTSPVSMFQAKGTEKPTTGRVYDIYYSLGSNPTKRAKTLRDFFRTARTSTNLIKFADLRYGQNTKETDFTWCVLMPGFPQEVEVINSKQKQPELALHVRLQEISYPIP